MSMIDNSMIETPTTQALTRFLDVDVARSKLIMANMANIDTPGYHTRDLNFHAEMGRASAAASAGQLGGLDYADFAPVAYPVRGLVERPDGNNVSVERKACCWPRPR